MWLEILEEQIKEWNQMTSILYEQEENKDEIAMLAFVNDRIVNLKETNKQYTEERKVYELKLVTQKKYVYHTKMVSSYDNVWKDAFEVVAELLVKELIRGGFNNSIKLMRQMKEYDTPNEVKRNQDSKSN